MGKSYGFDDMMSWVAENAQAFSEFKYLKLPTGVHLTRVIPHGNDPDYDASPNPNRFFRSFKRHDRGQKGDFWSGLCADYIMDNKNGIRKWLDEKGKLTPDSDDAAKFRKYGCPGCTTIDALIQAGYEADKITKMLRTKDGVLFNIFYILQADPEVNNKATAEAAVKTGMYIWETSPWGLERIGKALKTFASLAGLELEDEEDESDIIELLSITSGLNLAIGAEGEGVGKNSREYTYTFKGPKGKFKYLEDPYAKFYGREVKKPVVYDLEGPFPPQNLVAAEAAKYASYQRLVNEVKHAFGERNGRGGLLQQAGYEIPGDDPSDNPLDDNYSKSFADEVLAKPRNTKIKPGLKANRIDDEDEQPDPDAIARLKAKKKAAFAKAEEKARKQQEEEEEEEEEEERPKNKKRTEAVAKPSKKRVIEEEEEDDEEVEDDEEEEWIDRDAEDEVIEEVQSGKLQRKVEAEQRKAAADKKFREAVPEDDEEEEEEVKPKAKKKKFF